MFFLICKHSTPPHLFFMSIRIARNWPCSLLKPLKYLWNKMELLWCQTPLVYFKIVTAFLGTLLVASYYCQNLNLTSTQGWVWQYNDCANPTHTNSMSAISQLLLTRFWWNFKGRFLWTFRTDSNCQGDICPRNICPRDICQYQEYLSCYWPDFDETLKVGSCKHLEQIPTVRVTFVHTTFVLATFVHIRNISAVTDPILMKLYR